MKVRRFRLTLSEIAAVCAIMAVGLTVAVGALRWVRKSTKQPLGQSIKASARAEGHAGGLAPGYNPRAPIIDTSGLSVLMPMLSSWSPTASLEEIKAVMTRVGYRTIEQIDKRLADAPGAQDQQLMDLFVKSALFNYEGEPEKAYGVLEQARVRIERDEQLARNLLASVIYYQGVAAMRRGENDNCIMCRGESSCILPISPAAVHTIPTGSRLAIERFTEYLNRFPEDLEVIWLLNLAHMTLGEYPNEVDSRFRLDLTGFFQSEFDIGKFRDVAHLVGVNRFNQAGGAIMDDFDNDGLLDMAVTSWDATQSMSYYRNKGDATFEDRSERAGVTGQFGGLVCYQADYDNDGWLDIFIPRGAWVPHAIRPTLLHNDGKGRFADVTKRAGLLQAANSNAAAWADYDNDGFIDLFIGCERQLNRLYHNQGNGTFVEVAIQAGVQGDQTRFCKGCTWIDYDNDNYPDLFVNNLASEARLYHNDRIGRFTDETLSTNVKGPQHGFSCWTWDYDNDGWLDIFATCYDRTLADVVLGLLDKHHTRYTNRLFHNQQGKEFADRTASAGLDKVYASMGSNYADFDNDGFLDFYLGTGDPNLAMLVPNRMFKSVGGTRFAEISSSSGTGHLQKGHGVACGDWDRDGDVDLFVQTGGAVNGDKYHNILFQNPGQGNHSLTLKLVGKKTNRAAIGARIKIVTSGDKPMTIHRHVSSGSSFGANPLEQTVGLGSAARVALLEIHWPTSDSTQVFHDIAADQVIEVTEFATAYRVNPRPAKLRELAAALAAAPAGASAAARSQSPRLENLVSPRK
jgi:hypothetical protein